MNRILFPKWYQQKLWKLIPASEGKNSKDSHNEKVDSQNCEVKSKGLTFRLWPALYNLPPLKNHWPPHGPNHNFLKYTSQGGTHQKWIENH